MRKMFLIRKLAAVLFAVLAISNAFSQEVDIAAVEVIDLQAKVGQVPTRLTIAGFGQEFVLELQTNKEILSALPTVQQAKISAVDLFLRGTISGVADSWVRLNRISGQYSGAFYDGQELYLIDRADGLNSTLAAGVKPEETVLFRFSDMNTSDLVDHGGVEPGITHGKPDVPADYQSFVGHLKDIEAAKGSALLRLPVTIVSDVQFTADHPNDVASVVAGRVNIVDGIYASQLGVGIELLHHEILTDNGVLTATNSGDLLGGEFTDGGSLVQPGFRQFMVSGAGSDLPFGGLAHLFTGRNLDGSTVGIAYVGVLCSSGFGYGVNQDISSNTRSALIFAHELGHNFSAPHDGERACEDETFEGIMNSSINGSQQFSDCSLDQMSDDVARASCLVELDLLSDGFE